MYTQMFSPAFQAHCNTVLTYYTDLSRRLLASGQRISELNLQLARGLAAEWGENCQRLLAARDAATLGATVAERGRQSGAALRNYQQGVADLYARTNAELAQSAETHMPAVSRSTTALAEELIRNANEEAAKAGERQKDLLERMGAAQYGGNGHARNDDERQTQLPH